MYTNSILLTCLDICWLEKFVVQERQYTNFRASGQKMEKIDLMENSEDVFSGS